MTSTNNDLKWPSKTIVFNRYDKETTKEYQPTWIYKHLTSIHTAHVQRLEAKIEKLREVLETLQNQCGYASPWWIKIETVLNPDNPDLKTDTQDEASK